MNTSSLVAIVYEGFEQGTNPDTEQCTLCNSSMQNRESWYLFNCFSYDTIISYEIYSTLEFLCVPCTQHLMENMNDSVRHHPHTNLEGVK